MSDPDDVETIEEVDQNDLLPTETMPDRGGYDQEVENLYGDDGDLKSLEGEGVRINKATTNFNENRTWWDGVCDWFNDLVEDIQAALDEFFAKVAEFFKLVGELDQGSPYDMYAAGEGYLDAERIFSGQVLSVKSWNLKAANGSWTGDTANIYKAGIAAQEAALMRLHIWCGRAGTILMKHSQNVVGEYLKMRALIAGQVCEIEKTVSELIVVDPSKFLSIVQTICKLAVNLVMAMTNINTAFLYWANQSMTAITDFKSAMADQTGTDAGTWPTFVSS